jgi:hypothetical protein
MMARCADRDSPISTDSDIWHELATAEAARSSSSSASIGLPGNRRPEFHGFDGRFGGAVTCHHYDRLLGFGEMQLGNQFHAAQARQLQGRDDKITLVLSRLI